MTLALRIAILAHSTNPRGGVVHALELGDALTRLGHDVTVHAPDASGAGFFRNTVCRTVRVVASPVGRDVTAMVETRIGDYLRHFERAEHRRFDVWHAQDGISGMPGHAQGRGLISGFARTVHHVDTFDDPRLSAAAACPDCRRLSVRGQPPVAAVDCPRVGRDADLVGNGVDTSASRPSRTHRHCAARAPQPAARRAGAPRDRRSRGAQEYDRFCAHFARSSRNTHRAVW
jgi:hypothetical protein